MMFRCHALLKGAVQSQVQCRQFCLVGGLQAPLKPNLKKRTDICEDLDTKVRTGERVIDSVTNLGSLPPIDNKTYEEYFKDFQFSLDTKPKLDKDIEDSRFKGVAYQDKPIVLVFGWAGATMKNLNKYAEIYRDAGCLTLSYILPTRFIIEITGETPYLASRLIDELQLSKNFHRPVLFHLLSDTGKKTSRVNHS